MTKWRDFLIYCVIRMGFLLAARLCAWDGGREYEADVVPVSGGLSPVSGEVVCKQSEAMISQLLEGAVCG